MIFPAINLHLVRGSHGFLGRGHRSTAVLGLPNRVAAAGRGRVAKACFGFWQLYL